MEKSENRSSVLKHKNVTSDVRTEQRAIIKFCVDLGKTPIDTQKMLKQSSSFPTVSRTLVYKWHKRFSEGRNGFSDDKRSVRPLTCDENMKARIQDVIFQDRRLTGREIASLCDIGKSTTWEIITKDLEMNRVCARWVPRLLSDENKLRRMQSCSTFLRKFRAGGERWLDRIITTDETWLHYFDPETKQESSVWKHRGSPAPKKARVSKSMGKHMFIFFADRHGMILTHAVQSGRTVNADYYSKVTWLICHRYAYTFNIIFIQKLNISVLLRNIYLWFIS